LALTRRRCALRSAADAAAAFGDDGGDIVFEEVEVDSDGEEARAAMARRGGGGGAGKGAGKAGKAAAPPVGGKAPRRRAARD
jgi:hypothetical protein